MINEQSYEAWQSIQDSLPEARAKVRDFIAAQGKAGASVDEASEAMRAFPSSISPRFTELRKSGDIVKVGTRPTRSGRNAGVYTLAQLARKEEA